LAEICVVPAAVVDADVVVADVADADDDFDELLPQAAASNAIGARSNTSVLRMEPKT
jgi:hypothetical protein